MTKLATIMTLHVLFLLQSTESHRGLTLVRVVRILRHTTTTKVTTTIIATTKVTTTIVTTKVVVATILGITTTKVVLLSTTTELLIATKSTTVVIVILTVTTTNTRDFNSLTSTFCQQDTILKSLWALQKHLLTNSRFQTRYEAMLRSVVIQTFRTKFNL